MEYGYNTQYCTSRIRGNNCTKHPTSEECTVLEYSFKLVTTLYESRQCTLIGGYTVLVHSTPYSIHVRYWLQTCQHHVFPKEPSKGSAASVTVLISSTGTKHKSTVTCHLHCYHTWQRMKKKKGFNKQPQQQQKWRAKCDPSQKWPLRTCFECASMRALRMIEFKSITIFINECIYIFI